MLRKLPPRERQIVDILYEHGTLSVTEICEALSDPLSGSAVRVILTRLTAKGFVRRTHTDKGYVFSPGMPEAAARNSALGDVVRVFFNGSAVGAASALMGMASQFQDEELDELEAMIARARAAKAKER